MDHPRPFEQRQHREPAAAKLDHERCRRDGSSGRVVVSSRIQAYEKTQDLLVMSESETDEDLPQRFAETLTRLTELNSVQLQLARIALALDNTYKRQIDRIFKLISSSKS